ncbi:MAG: hypothetical protein LAT57_12625, partial [Balneolales bacterium]|nr:hypothetical protein [Balneolales bacterium]
GRPSIGVNAALSGLYGDPLYFQLSTNQNWVNNLLIHDLTMPTLSMGSHHLTARLGLIHQAHESMHINNNSLPELDFMAYRAELAYAISISDYFSIVAVQHVSYLTSDDESGLWNYVADFGLVYMPDGAVSYGMVFRGLGDEIRYETLETGETTYERRMARQALEIGLTFRFPIEERTYLGISFSNEKRFGENGLWYKGGVEVTPIPAINLRGGVMANFDESLFIPRAGFGLNAKHFQVDYMFAPHDSIGEQFHQLSITIQI